MKVIKVKFFDKDLYSGDNMLTKVGGKSDWIDLRCAEDIDLNNGNFKLIRLGVAMQLPKGYEAYILPRSSTFKNWGILQTNSMGVIDETYCGDNDEWKLPVYATRDVCIKRGERICQFRIQEHQPETEFEVVECLNNEDRSGFGSTGK